MKKIKYLLIVLLLVFIVCGCDSKQKNEAGEKCKKSAKELVEKYSDANIKECYCTYDIEDDSESSFCLDDDTMYQEFMTYKKDSEFYDAFLSHYDVTVQYVDGGDDKNTYYFEYSIDELK